MPTVYKTWALLVAAMMLCTIPAKAAVSPDFLSAFRQNCTAALNDVKKLQQDFFVDAHNDLLGGLRRKANRQTRGHQTFLGLANGKLTEVKDRCR